MHSPINAALEAREAARQREQRMDQIRYADNAYQVKDADMTGSQGNYDQFGNFRPSSQTIVMNRGKYGTELTNALYGQGGGLPKAQIGIDDNVVLEGDSSGTISLEGNLDIVNSYRSPGSCSGGTCDWTKSEPKGEWSGGIQLETGVSGKPNVTTTTTESTTQTDTHLMTGDTGSYEYDVTTTTPGSTSKHYNLNDFLFNVGPKAFATFKGDSGFAFGFRRKRGLSNNRF